MYMYMSLNARERWFNQGSNNRLRSIYKLTRLLYAVETIKLIKCRSIEVPVVTNTRYINQRELQICEYKDTYENYLEANSLSFIWS